MEASIGRFRSRYRSGSVPQRARELAGRCDRIARTRLPALLEEALAESFGETEVVVIRRVAVRGSFLVGGELSDDRIARRWARALAAAARRTAGRGGGPEGPVARFPDQASYLARFLAELVEASRLALDRWYFAPLRPHVRPTPAATTRAVLEAHRGETDAVLAALARHGDLDGVLAALDEESLALLWRLGEPAGDAGGAERRTFLELAARLLERLLPGRVPARSPDLAARYLAASPGTADWNDPAGLADAVADAARFLVREGALERAMPETVPADLLGAEWEWLDRDRLRRGLEGEPEMTEATVPAVAEGAAAGRPPERPTPRQEALLEDLRTLLSDTDARLDASRPTSKANALRLFALLVDRYPRWSGSTLARRMVAHLLHAWERGRPVPGLAPLARPSHVPHVLGRPSPPTAPRVRSADRAVARDGLATECAGAFLMLRTLLDLRLPGIVERTAFPRGFEGSTAMRSVLVVLATAWAGPAAIVDGRLDPALAWLGGYPRPPESEELRETWRTADDGARESFLALVRRLVADQAEELDGSMDELRRLFDAGRIVADGADADALAWTAAATVRVWGRWLKGVGDSSLPFLLDNALRRPGRIELDDETLVVEMASAPLDLVVRMAGYFGELEALPWLGGRRVVYRLRMT